MESITFETKCYENDWQFLLQSNYLDQMAERCGCSFTHKQLLINNVNDLKTVCKFADRKVANSVIDAYYVVDQYAEEALRFFQLDKRSLGKGYYYSIAELVGLYISQTTFHLHFSSDARMEPGISGDWIIKAMELMKKNPEYVVANPTWNHEYKRAKKESIDETDDFYIGYGFSDQCYLVQTALFRQPIYNERHPDSERYPRYGGELFEKRVDSYMRNHEVKRLTSKQVSYIHQNFPKNKVMRWIRKQILK